MGLWSWPSVTLLYEKIKKKLHHCARSILQRTGASEQTENSTNIQPTGLTKNGKAVSSYSDHFYMMVMSTLSLCSFPYVAPQKTFTMQQFVHRS